MMNSVRVGGVVLVLLGVGMVGGCTPQPTTGTVSGTVTLDGQPYDDAAIMFVDLTSGQAANADIEPDGTFKVEQPMQVGTYKIYLAPPTVDDTAEPAAIKIDETVDPKYWNETTTDIEITVKEGENDVEVELKTA